MDEVSILGNSLEEVLKRPELENWQVKELKSWEALSGKGKTTLFKATLTPPQHNPEWAVQKIIEAISRETPKPQAEKNTPSEGKLLEIDLFDIHINKLALATETGREYNSQIAVDLANEALQTFLSKARDVSMILFPVGNDLLNVDSSANSTTKGTPQDVDTRWTQALQIAKDFCFSAIDALQSVAPCYVPIISGNHDYHSAIAIGDILEAKYSANDRVTVDNSRSPRKYYRFGSNLLGFTHGRYESAKALRNLMPIEAPDLWAETTHREWHLGDKHRESVDTDGGITIRTIPSLCSGDFWHTQQGYVSTPKAQAFVWDFSNGLEEVYYYNAA